MFVPLYMCVGVFVCVCVCVCVFSRCIAILGAPPQLCDSLPLTLSCSFQHESVFGSPQEVVDSIFKYPPLREASLLQKWGAKRRVKGEERELQAEKEETDAQLDVRLRFFLFLVFFFFFLLAFSSSFSSCSSSFPLTLSPGEAGTGPAGSPRPSEPTFIDFFFSHATSGNGPGGKWALLRKLVTVKVRHKKEVNQRYRFSLPLSLSLLFFLLFLPLSFPFFVVSFFLLLALFLFSFSFARRLFFVQCSICQ